MNEFDTKNLLLDKVPFDIHEMIKNVAASFEGRCTQKKISIELVFARKHLKVVADKRKIQQVLYNLLDNAIKFSDQDSIITIETTERGDKIYTSVKDYGIGIPRNALNKDLGEIFINPICPVEKIKRNWPWACNCQRGDTGSR